MTRHSSAASLYPDGIGAGYCATCGSAAGVLCLTSSNAIKKMATMAKNSPMKL
jgi:hypothetical protein